MSMKFSAPTALSLALGLAVAVRGACCEELVTSAGVAWSLPLAVQPGLPDSRVSIYN
jgi:hypothetical protein